MATSPYRTALVTGASSGIGAAVARALAGRGLTVHALARRADRLEALAAESGCVPHAVDLRDVAAIERTCRDLVVDVLVNGAGSAAGYGGIHEAGAEGLDAVIDVNLRAVMHLVRVIVPGMVRRGRGHVINIGSVNGLHVIDGMSVYGTAKTAVHALSGLMRLDLFGHRVRVSEICPGRVRSEFHARAMGDAAAAEEAFYRGREVLAPEDIVPAVLFALDAPERVNVGLIEITPVMQVAGGGRFFRTDGEG